MGKAPQELSVICISITAFDEKGELDEAGYRQHLKRLGDAGVSVYIGGSGSGEGYSLTREERDRCLNIAYDELGGKVPVYADGVEPRTTKEMVRFVREIESIKVDAVRIMALDPGHGSKPNPKEIERYLNTVAEATDRPLILTSHQAAGYVLPLDAVERVVDRYPHIYGINYGGTDTTYLADMIRRFRGRIMVHCAGCTNGLTSLTLGANGFMGNEGNFAPTAAMAVIKAFKAGDAAALRESFGLLMALAAIVRRYGGSSLRGLKPVLKLFGLPGGPLREPRMPLDAAEVEKMAKALDQLQIPGAPRLPKNLNVAGVNKSAAQPKTGRIMRELSAYIAAARRRALPAAVAECAKHHLLDTLAAMISGTTLPPGKSAIRYVKALGGTPESSVVGTMVRTNALNAALANGMLAHADETDDSHSKSLTHPGCSIVAAALAMAERERQSGTALLRAVALGYDVGTRMSMALGAKEFARISHTSHAFGGTFGATAAGAALGRLDARQVRHALSYAAQQASGVSTYGRDPDHIEKAFDFGGMPARNGVTAATLVASGCTGVDDVFSGERNFFAAYDESARIRHAPAPACLVRGLGRTWEIVNTNIKRWSVGSPIQAPLDSLLELMRAEAITAADVESVVVRVYTAGAKISDNNPMPNINMQHLCALMLVDGYLTFEAAHDEKRMRDRRVLAVRRRVKLVADAALEKLRPEKHGIVELRLKDGRRLRHHTRTVRGTVQNPMTRAEVEEKCRYLTAPVLGDKRSRALCAAIWKLERTADVRALRPLLVPRSSAN